MGERPLPPIGDPMQEPAITEELIAAHQLTPEEYHRALTILGREPTHTELGIFSVMWSEHCSYKSSKVHLQALPTSGPRILQGPGENAGVVDLGDGLAAVFKMESHNHPSYIEPYQGAATGVGGIIRDIFTMGARPIALLDSLRFGPLTESRTRYLMGGVVAGISGYGNAVGVPTVGGEVGFGECYSHNPLVNVLCLGIAPIDKLFYARAGGIGNPVIYVGAKTGRDGIHGATMASETFDEKSEERRPTVQVGDPFREKLLIEACLELMRTDALVGVQDMGAAGLTCSSCEMASRAGTGVEIDVRLVPRREEGMTPYEVMLSESQERMLLVVRQGAEATVQKIFAEYDLDAVVVGRVTGDGMMRVREGECVVAEIPVKGLVADAPVYRRPVFRPAWQDAVQGLDVHTIPLPRDYGGVLLQLLASPAIACKATVWERYDHMLFLNTVVGPGADAVVLRLKGTDKGIALATDGNARYTFLDPYIGGMIAVVEAARNVVASGAEPIAITNCLNFGDPTRPEIMWQFAEAVRGMVAACSALETPVTGGNVSLYNETMGKAIFPTPIVGMLGILPHISHATTPTWKEAGDVVVLLGETQEELGGSEYLKVCHGLVQGRPPAVELDLERRVQRCCLEAIRAGVVRSAHDCSDGGLAVALVECCISEPDKQIGVDVSLPETMRPDALLFGESQSRIILSLRGADLSRLRAIADHHGVVVTPLGRTGGSRFICKGQTFQINLPLADLDRAWRDSLPAFFGQIQG
ncbi:MAG: phosphoribosylformylglycinamidine synthase subunit PurL [candidate division NC10 bacterium]|nr:phosphoribosylformylglycinamidine synthase subunit PurL [candidate division NC10 bacterium]